MANITVGTTRSRSASAVMMLADLPPSSSTTFFSDGAACEYTSRPTASEPVKLTMSTPGWVVSACPAATSPVTMFSTPGGSPASSAISPRTNASSGVVGAGLSTTVHPAARAGASLRMLRNSGKL